MFFRKRKAQDGDPAQHAAGAAAEEPPAAVSAPSTQFLTGEASKDRRSVQVLLEAIRRVSQHQDLEELLRDIVDSSVEVTGAERGILLLTGDEGSLDVRVARSRGGEDLEGELRFSTTVAGRVAERVEPIRATVNTESEALDLGRSVYDLKLRAVMCVPLAAAQGDLPAGTPAPPVSQGGARPKGVLYVDSRAATRQFSQRDLSLFAALAQQIAVALENAQLHLDSLEKERLRQSMELASAIQRDLMPKVVNDFKGFDVHGWYLSAEDTAGDFFDFVKARDGRLAVAVADATGHGVGPALISATAQSGMRAYLRMMSDPGEVVTMLNQDLCERVDDGRFLTMFLGLLAPDGTLEALNAGHTPPLLWRKRTGAIETIAGNGPALGMLDDVTYESHEPIALEPGDVLVVYTDGLSEARSPHEPDAMLGEEGMRRVLGEQAAGGAAAKEITARLAEAAVTLAEGQREDDMTLVVVRRSADA